MPAPETADALMPSVPVATARLLQRLGAAQGNRLAKENERLLAKNARLHAVAERLIATTEAFLRDSTDPGTEALAAVWEARKEIQNG